MLRYFKGFRSTSNPNAYPGPIWQKVYDNARAKGGHDINLGTDPKSLRNIALVGGGLAITYSVFCTRLYALPYESWWRPGKTESFRAILLRELEGTPTAIRERDGRANDLRYLGEEQGRVRGSSSSSPGGTTRRSIRETIVKDASENRMPVLK